MVSFLFVVRGFGSLVAFYENVMESSTNINGTFKLLLMKVSVGAIVIQVGNFNFPANLRSCVLRTHNC